MATRKAKRVTVEVLRCSAHRVCAVVIDGTRVTPEKCCGSWDVEVGSWTVDPAELAEAIADGAS